MRFVRVRRLTRAHTVRWRYVLILDEYPSSLVMVYLGQGITELVRAINIEEVRGRQGAKRKEALETDLFQWRRIHGARGTLG